MGAVLNMEVNNLSLRWPMHEGNKDGVDLWSWLKVKYESSAKLDLLRSFYGRKLVRLSLSPVGCLATTSNSYRCWQLCGNKSTLLFNRNIGLLLKWLKTLKTRSSLDAVRLLRIGINPSASFVM